MPFSAGAAAFIDARSLASLFAPCRRRLPRRAARDHDAAPWSRSRSSTGPRGSDALAPRCTPAHAHTHLGTRPGLGPLFVPRRARRAAAVHGMAVAP
jgi:hypothetical protein